MTEVDDGWGASEGHWGIPSSPIESWELRAELRGEELRAQLRAGLRLEFLAVPRIALRAGRRAELKTKPRAELRAALKAELQAGLVTELGWARLQGSISGATLKQNGNSDENLSDFARSHGS